MPKLQKNAQLWVLVVVVLLVAPHGTACLCSQHNPGVALRRTRRVDGVEVDRSLPLDAVRALRNATTPTAPVRGRLDTARDPRGGSRRTGARRWRTGVGWRPTTTQYRRRPLAGAVLGSSPVTLGNRARRGPKRLKNQKETTHRHDSRKRRRPTPRIHTTAAPATAGGLGPVCVTLRSRSRRRAAVRGARFLEAGAFRTKRSMFEELQ